MSYHDLRLIDYLKFGFPLDIPSGHLIKSNATDKHSSTHAYTKDIDDFFRKEIQEGVFLALLIRNLTLHLPGLP